MAVRNTQTTLVRAERCQVLAAVDKRASVNLYTFVSVHIEECESEINLLNRPVT